MGLLGLITLLTSIECSLRSHIGDITDRDAAEQTLRTLTRTLVRLRLRKEQDMHTRHVLRDRERLHRVSTLTLDTHLERAQSGNLHTVTILHHILLSVTDNGTGMSQEKLRSVMNGEYGGFGLTIAARLAEQNNGTLHLSSEEGKGTRAELVFRGQKETVPENTKRPEERYEL